MSAASCSAQRRRDALSNADQLPEVLYHWDHGDGKSDPYWCASCGRHRARNPTDGSAWQSYLCPICLPYAVRMHTDDEVRSLAWDPMTHTVPSGHHHRSIWDIARAARRHNGSDPRG
jgi:hypothetical protein